MADAARPDIDHSERSASGLHILTDCAYRSGGKSTTRRVRQVQTRLPGQFELYSHETIPQKKS